MLRFTSAGCAAADAAAAAVPAASAAAPAAAPFRKFRRSTTGLADLAMVLHLGFTVIYSLYHMN
jgi:hypothetical protein